ncbi:MAG: hypothetical protein DRI56_03220 [Chloroflexota bacterium]|nr:MAG: hypothetical protein DRI56_03220 [Chloroflexota bacterium]
MVDRMVDAILKVAEAIAEGKPVSRLEIEERLRQPAQIESETTTGVRGQVGMTFTEGMGRGMGLPMTKGALAAEIGQAVIQGFKALSGDITGVLKSELSSIIGSKMALEHTEPLKRLENWALEMARSGHTPSFDELERMHARFEAIGDRQSEALSRARRVGSLVPDIVQDILEDSEDFWLRTAKKTKKWADREWAIYRNSELHED